MFPHACFGPVRVPLNPAWIRFFFHPKQYFSLTNSFKPSKFLQNYTSRTPLLLVPMMSVVSQDNYDPSMHGFGTENSQTARFLRSSIGNSACVRLLCTTDTSGPALAATAGAAVTVPPGFRKTDGV